MSLPSRFGVISGMECVPACGVGVMSSFLMMPTFVMLSGLFVVMSGMLMVF